jgi:ferrous iron transport protein B
VTTVVAIAGNPNTGKTSLFNALTGLRAKVGNYPGVTVERRSGSARSPKRDLEVIDIPGCYSLLARTGEEQIAVAALAGIGEKRPDVLVCCVDATQLARSSYLVMQALELGLRCVVALTMVDEAHHAAPDARALGQALGCEVVVVNPRARAGIGDLLAAIDRAVEAGPAEPIWRWTPTPALRERIAQVRAALPAAWSFDRAQDAPASDALALWALMSIEGDDELLDVPESLRAAARAAAPDAETARAIDDEVVLARWQWLDAQVASLVRGKADRSATERVDRVLLHRVAGFAIFTGVMFVVFMALFAWADPAIGLIEQAFGWLGDQTRAGLGEGIVTDFLVDGVINGVGSVLVFLPQILLLFFFIGILEDCGYMARVAYLMDRIMRTMNLHGRAFVPMLSGFACAVPAVLATRTMERKRDRLLTMMVVPLMTCSARLPVYTLVIGALFPTATFGISTKGMLMSAMYLFSVATALIAAWVLSRTVKPLRGRRLPFVIELPPYRLPRLGDVIRMMWEKTSAFLREAGTVILACTIVLWALLSFPRELPSGSPDYDALIEAAPTDEAKAALEAEESGARLRNSYAGRLGHAIEPAIEPLGFDWKIGIGLIGAFAAREVFVSTMGVVYSVGADADEQSEPLREALRNETDASGRAVYTPLVGLSLMVFFALACQCLSTLAVVKRETATYRWPLFLFAYMTALAWTLSFLVFQIGSALGY